MNRILTKALTELCEEENIKFDSFSENWIFRLEKNNVVKFITGFKFPNNDMSVAEICNDKVGLSNILDFYNIENVKHIPIFDYDYKNIDDAFFYDILEKHGKIVIKENRGTCGRNIFIYDNIKDIRNKLEEMLKTEYLVAISPFHKIEFEYRMIMLNNKPEIIYGKKVKHVVGDGVKSIYELCVDNNITTEFLEKGFPEKIPKKKEKVQLSNFHNLSKYGEFFAVDDEVILKKLSKIATEVTRNLGINFCSVDIVDTLEGLKVLEVNSGVMAETYGSYGNYENVKEMYRKAVLSCF